MADVNTIRQKSKRNDDYETPKVAYELLLPYINPAQIIWDPFYCEGLCKRFMNELGFSRFINQPQDAYETHPEEFDVIVTNPPFSQKKKAVEYLLSFNKPTFILLPISCLATQWMQKLNETFKLIVPPKRIHFLLDGEQTKENTFDCAWFYFGTHLRNEIIFS